MVCEIQMRDQEGEWEAFLADHMPPALDDKLKKISYDSLSKAFASLSPETMLKAIPVTMPMTHLTTVSGKKMEGIAKYPLDAWAAAGNPCFTNEKWAMICMMLAEMGQKAVETGEFPPADAEVFGELFVTASTMKESGKYR